MTNLAGFRRIAASVAIAAALMAAPIGAFAQEIDHYDPVSGDPTNVPLLEPSRPLAAWALTTVFLVGTLAIAFKSSKRSHLD